MRRRNYSIVSLREFNFYFLHRHRMERQSVIRGNENWDRKEGPDRVKRFPGVLTILSNCPVNLLIILLPMDIRSEVWGRGIDSSVQLLINYFIDPIRLKLLVSPGWILYQNVKMALNIVPGVQTFLPAHCFKIFVNEENGSLQYIFLLLEEKC